MNKNKLIRIDNSLDSTIDKDSILISKRGYYIYFNKPNEKTKIIYIHSHICGECAWGSGKITEKEVGKNGVWIGPFKTWEQAENFAKNHFDDSMIVVHTCVEAHI